MCFISPKRRRNTAEKTKPQVCTFYISVPVRFILSSSRDAAFVASRTGSFGFEMGRKTGQNV